MCRRKDRPTWPNQRSMIAFPSFLLCEADRRWISVPEDFQKRKEKPERRSKPGTCAHEREALRHRGKARPKTAKAVAGFGEAGLFVFRDHRLRLWEQRG